MTKKNEYKDTFKDLKEDGFWRMVFESLAAHPDEVVRDKVKSKAAVQECWKIMYKAYKAIREQVGQTGVPAHKEAVEKHMHCRKGVHRVKQQLVHYWHINGLCGKTERDTMQFVREASNLGVVK